MTSTQRRPFGSLPVRSRECASLIAEVAQEFEARGEAITSELLDAIGTQLEEFQARPLLADEFHDACRDSLTLINAMVQSWSDPGDIQPPEAALEWARGLVRRDLSLDVLLRVYRLGQAAFHDMWHERLCLSDSSPEVVLEASRAISTYVFAWVDAILRPLVVAYQLERDRRMRGTAAAREETLREVLEGRLNDAQLASSRLAYELRRLHQGFVVWTAAGHESGSGAWLERVTHAMDGLRGPTGARGLLVRHTFDSVTACLSGDEDVGLVLARLLSRIDLPNTYIARGAPASGLDGFRRTIGEADRARRVASLLHRTAAITLFSEIEVLDLLTRDPAAARSFAANALGRLVAPDEATQRIVATLSCYYAEGESFARAARKLGVHENTVSYRVHKAEELAGITDSWVLRTAVALAPLLAPGAPERLRGNPGTSL
jgi:hypothetical protein